VNRGRLIALHLADAYVALGTLVLLGLARLVATAEWTWRRRHRPAGLILRTNHTRGETDAS
jgi:hypothetical protein